MALGHTLSFFLIYQLVFRTQKSLYSSVKFTEVRFKQLTRGAKSFKLESKLYLMLQFYSLLVSGNIAIVLKKKTTTNFLQRMF